jgi:hypothetical protein
MQPNLEIRFELLALECLQMLDASPSTGTSSRDCLMMRRACRCGTTYSTPSSGPG